ncbi:MAG: HD-GYP domain-containing protein [Firmicutes bacterium]|nr:HD-GYP domain-containing protein [Bacillota bacterium]
MKLDTKQKKIIDRIKDIVEAGITGKRLPKVKIPQSSELYELALAVGRLAERYQMARETIHMLNQQLNRNNAFAITALIEALDAKDPYTRGHSERVSIYSLLLAERLDLSSDEIESIHIASYLHDIGKIGIREDILNKPDKLTMEEYEQVKNHAAISSQIVSRLPGLAHICDIVRHHHERHDGAGYPDGLKGGDIPLGARILAIADAFDAMTSNRPYKDAFEPKDALQEIKKCAGGQFDPELADTFVEAYSKTYGRRIPYINAS